MRTQRKQSRIVCRRRRWSALSSIQALRTPQSVAGLVYAACIFSTGTAAAEAGFVAETEPQENATTTTPTIQVPAPTPAVVTPSSAAPEPTTLAPVPTTATPMESPTTQPPTASPTPATAPPATPTPTSTPAPVVTPSPPPTSKPPTTPSPPVSQTTTSPSPSATPTTAPNTDNPSPTSTQSPASSSPTTSSPAPNTTGATPATRTPPSSSATDSPMATSAPEPTTAPSTSSPQTTTATPAQSLASSQQSAPTSSASSPTTENKETVTMYNSTTLPPGLDSSVLDGGELVNVETKATTRNGETSVSYTIVVKKGDVVEKVQQPGYNTTDPAAVVLPSSSDITSSTTDINNASSNSNSSSTAVTVSTVASSGGLSSGVIVGLVLGALVLGLLIAGFVMRRRNGKKSVVTSASSTKSSARTVEEGYSTLETIHMECRDTVMMNNTRHMSYESDMRPSSRRRGSSGGIWEDAVIVAARIPFDKVHVGKLISRGGFGEVYKGTYRDQVVAIKKLLPETRKDLQHIENFLCEIKLQASLDHPHIVTFLGVAWESLSDLYALSEFMERGDLRSLLVKFNEPGSGTPQGFSYEKVKIALQIAHALTYLHSLQPQLLHRDLKSRNILLTSKLDAKLTDFGSSRVCATSHDATMTAGVGSSLWMAPEVMVGKRYDEKSDVFSLGIVLSELDTHELPYSHRKEASSGGEHIASNSRSLGTGGTDGRSLPETAILQMVSMGKLQVQFSRNCPPEMVALAHKCINVDPHERPTAAEVLYQLHVVLRLFETM